MAFLKSLFVSAAAGDRKQDQVLIPGLPEDLAFRCLIRVPRRDHGKLRCVNSRWRHFVSSEEFTALRQNLGLAEPWLYLLSRDKLERLRWHVLDPLSRKWMQLPDMPEDSARRYGACYNVVGRELFVMGGCDRLGDPTDQVLRYDAFLNKWTDAAPRMQVRRCHFVSSSYRGRLYAIGGIGCTSTLTSWEILDLQQNRWSLHEFPLMVPDPGESLVMDDKIYIRHCSATVVPALYAAAYDPETNSWAALDNEMSRQWWGPALSVGNEAYLLDHTHGIRLMILNKETQEWCPLGRLSPRCITPPCSIGAMGRQLFLVGRGLRTIVLDLDRTLQSGSVLVTSTIEGPQKCAEDIVLSCNVIEV